MSHSLFSLSFSFARRLILHSTRELKLKSICVMVNIPSSIQTDVEKLFKGWLKTFHHSSHDRKKNKWHLSRMINFISTRFLFLPLPLIYCVCSSYCEREFRDCRLQTCYVQSPAYPGLYPRALKCRYRLHTRQPFIKLYLQNEQFAVDGQRYVAQYFIH